MPEQKPRTVEDVSSCRILKQHFNGGYMERSPYEDGMPNKRVKPEAGYNQVACEFYMQEQGKCFIRHFFPRYAEIDYAPCLFCKS